MKLVCTSCEKALRIADDLAGQRILCPACGESLRVPADTDTGAAAPWVEEKQPEQATESAGGDTKTCPMCGGTIKAAARKCRFCGEMLPGVVGPDSRPTSGVWRIGDQLVMSKDAELPSVCVKTNRPADDWLRRNLYWHNSWIYLLILVSIWVYVLVALIVRQKAIIKVGLCRERIVRRRWTIAGAWLTVVAGVALAIVGMANAQPGNSGWIAIPVGLVLLLAGAIVGSVQARIVAPSRITKEYVWLKGVHPDYLASLPPFPGE